MKEIAELQTQQKNEIEALYIRLGKPLPPNLGFLHSAPPSSRRRRTSKNKLKGGKLLNPLVQQLRSGTSSTSRYTGLLSICLFFVLVVVLLCNCSDFRKGAEFSLFFMLWLKFAYCKLFLKWASFGTGSLTLPHSEPYIPPLHRVRCLAEKPRSTSLWNTAWLHFLILSPSAIYWCLYSHLWCCILFIFSYEWLYK